MTTSFDDLNQDYAGTNRPSEPLWSINLDDPYSEDQILQWMIAEKNFLVEHWRDYNEGCRKNAARYRGIQYNTTQVSQSTRDRDGTRATAVKKFVVNNIYDFTENLTARQVKYKPAIACIPLSNEYEDKISSKVAKNVVDDVWYRTSFDNVVFPEAAKTARIHRESYTFTLWDKNKGKIHPLYDKDKKIPLLDEHGSHVKDNYGNPVFIDRVVRIGEVEYCIETPETILPQVAKSYSDVEYLFRKTKLPTALLRLRHPELAEKIRPSNIHWYNFDTCEEEQLNNETVVWELYHKSTEAMPHGRMIQFTENCILMNVNSPYNHGELPCDRLVDIRVPESQRGLSFIDMVDALNGVYNNYTNMINRSLILASQAKWVMPVGSAKVEALGNDHTIVQYRGPVPPQLVTYNPVSTHLFNERDKIKEEFRTISGIYPISQGQPPVGIKSGIAIQYLNEQENERHNEMVVKTNEFIRAIAKKTFSVAAQYYDDSDGRVLRVMGSDKRWSIKELNMKALSKDYEFTIEGSSALPQSKSARTQTIMDLAESFPGLLPPERVASMLELGTVDEFYDSVTASTLAAEKENEDLVNGIKIKPPADYEDLIIHWGVHAKLVQDYSFKNDTPQEIVETALDHLMATEMMMHDKAIKSTAFAQQLATLKNYPLVYELPQEEPAPVPMPMEGEPMMGNVPQGTIQPEPQMPYDLAPPAVEQAGVPVEPMGAQQQ